MTTDMALVLALEYERIFTEAGIPAERCDALVPPTIAATQAHAHALLRETLHNWRQIVEDPWCELREAVCVAQCACWQAGMFLWPVIEEQRETGIVKWEKTAA